MATMLVIGVATLLAIGLRVYWLTRPGMLLGSPEYDDGAYLGSAIRLLDGALPYRDFAFVHPPGITLLMVPFALLGEVTSSSTAMAAARIASVCAGVASVPLAGWLVRHRGVAATTIVCGLLAVLPAAIRASSTPFQEPWLVVLCLLAALAVFHGDELTDRRARLLWGGAAIGVAVTVKLFAVIPGIVLLVVLLAGRVWRRAAFYVGGAVAGVCVTAAPFFVLAPHAFVRDVLLTQLGRTDVMHVPISVRAGQMLGLDPLSLTSRQIAAIAAAVTAAAILCSVAASILHRSAPPPLDMFALATAALVAVAFGVPAQFYPHYAAFSAPFIALAFGLSISGLTAALAGSGRGIEVGVGRWAGAVIAVAAIGWCAFIAVRDVRHETALAARRPAVVLQTFIPRGACVLTDDASMTIVADRFRSRVAGCTSMADAFGTTLALGHGHNGVTGAGRYRAVRTAWLDAFSHADYVVLGCGPPRAKHCNGFTNRRIPWTPPILGYFKAHFQRVPGAPGEIYERRSG